MNIEGERTDWAKLGAGACRKLNMGPYGELLVGRIGLGECFESSRHGKVFSLSQLALTIAATHNIPLDNVADTAVVGILNPSGSSKAAVILEQWLTSISGTPPASAYPVTYIAANQTAISANPSGTIVNCFGEATGSAMQPYNNIALAGLNTATGRIQAARPWGGAVFAGAIAANHDQGYLDVTGGKVILKPGNLLAVMVGTAAGTSWVVSASITWAEIDWPL